jgi:hypothetical protein
MAVTLSDEQYGTVARALVKIAAGKRYRPGGRQQWINRAEMMNLAREAAASIKLRYLGDGGGGSSFPQEIGLEHRADRTEAQVTASVKNAD